MVVWYKISSVICLDESGGSFFLGLAPAPGQSDNLCGGVGGGCGSLGRCRRRKRDGDGVVGIFSCRRRWIAAVGAPCREMFKRHHFRGFLSPFVVLIICNIIFLLQKYVSLIFTCNLRAILTKLVCGLIGLNYKVSSLTSIDNGLLALSIWIDSVIATYVDLTYCDPLSDRITSHIIMCKSILMTQRTCNMRWNDSNISWSICCA